MIVQGQRKRQRWFVRKRNFFRRFGWRCVFCGRDMLENFDVYLMASQDHMVPRAAGGSDGVENRVAACYACNRLKGSVVVDSIEAAREAIAAGRRELEDRYRRELRREEVRRRNSSWWRRLLRKPR